MTKDEMREMMEVVFAECRDLRGKGQAEYAGGEEAFGNFIRLGTMLGLPKEKILIVYAMKHWDGIISHVNGHVSQREPVQGRINDLIVYLCILRGMVEESARGE